MEDVMALLETVVHLQSLDGQKLTGTILDSMVEPRGLAILVHGITSERNENGFYTTLAEQLAASGIASIRADWRCHGDNHLDSSELSLSGMINDIQVAAEKLWQTYPKAASCTGLVAASFGGGAAVLWSDATIRENIKSIVLLAPVLDYAKDLFRTGQWSEATGLAPDSVAILDRDGEVQTSSLPVGRSMINEIPRFNVPNALRASRAPKTIFHGDADSDVSIEWSKPYCTAEYGVELIPVAGVDHGFVKPGTDFDDPETKQNHKMIIPQIAARVISHMLGTHDDE